MFRSVMTLESLEGNRITRNSARASVSVGGHAARFVAIFAGLVCTSAVSARTIPSDAEITPTPPAALPATVSPATFASWFQSGHPTLDGVVNPANSVTFTNNPSLSNVDFYQWAEQMFLWVTSPTPPTYGGGEGRIFSSPRFSMCHHRTPAVTALFSRM